MESMSRKSDIPKYAQIREKLRAQIASRQLAPGERLPSESELAQSFGVSRMTVRQALLDLLTEGLVHRQHGVGTFVSQICVAANYTKMTSFTEDAIDQGKSPSSIVLNVGMETTPEEVAQALAIDPGESVFHLERLRLADGLPVAIQNSYLPSEICPPKIEEQDWSTQSLFELLENSGHRLTRAIETISARLADSVQAKHLKIKPGSALLYIERITFNEDGRPAEFVRMLNRPDRYRCTITLVR